MAYLKPKNIHGKTYWYVVESRRVNGQVKTVNLAYLGKADDILSRWQQLSTPKDCLKSYSHGAVAVMLSLAKRLGIAEIINTHIKPPRRGTRDRKMLSVGDTLVMAAIGISTESLYYDVTNFFTFIDSRNERCDLPQRVTLVMDKGNISNKNWRLLDESGFGYVASLPPGQYADYSTRPLEEFSSCLVPDVGQMKCLRARATVAGKERTVIVLDSPSLRDGQLRGLNQQLKTVLFGLTHLEYSLANANRRRRGEQSESQIAKILKSVLARRMLRDELTKEKQRSGYWKFDWWIDIDAYRWLSDRIYGRRLLVSNHADWRSCDLIWAYWGQSEAELVFRQMKDQEFLALRPQFHWTDQKIWVHSFCCVVGYLLAALIRRHARQMGYTEGLNALLEMLTELRIVLRSEIRRRVGRRRIHWQLEETDTAAMKLYQSLVLPEYTLGTTPP